MSAPFPRASELFLTATLCRIRFPGYSIPPKTIKEPTVLSTMQLDFKLVIRNCFQFAPAGTPVNLVGIELQRLFDDKWKKLTMMWKLRVMTINTVRSLFFFNFRYLQSPCA